MTRTYTQIKNGDTIPTITYGISYVTVATDKQVEPDKETTPEGYYEASYIAIEIPVAEWISARASIDEVSLAKAEATTDAFEAMLEIIGGV